MINSTNLFGLQEEKSLCKSGRLLRKLGNANFKVCWLPTSAWGTVIRTSSLRWMSVIFFTLSPGWWEWHLGNVNYSYSGLSAKTEGSRGPWEMMGEFPGLRKVTNVLGILESLLKGPQSPALRLTLCPVKDSPLSKWSERLHLLTFSAEELPTLQGSPFQVLKAVLHNTEPKTCLHITSSLWFQLCSLMLCQINLISLSQECLSI